MKTIVHDTYGNEAVTEVGTTLGSVPIDRKYVCLTLVGPDEEYIRHAFTPAQARRLAKSLSTAADILEGSR